MATRPLILTPYTLNQITAARDRARKRPILWDQIKPFARDSDDENFEFKLKDRKPGSEALSDRAESVHIARGYRANISFEEQPAGICRHLSVSVDKRGKLPSPEAVNAIALAFGFDEIEKGTSRVWMEEFEPGWHAVNVVQIEVEREAGHA